MANQRREAVGYRKFTAHNTLSEGLLPVYREGGELEAKLAAHANALAARFGQMADREAAVSGARQGALDAMAGRPEAGQLTSPDRPSRSQVNAPAEIRNLISQAAERHGVDPAGLMKIAELESSFNPNAKNPNSTASGLFQFVSGTAKEYGLTNPFDPAASADAGARLMKSNADSLRKALGREPTNGELYLAHQQGVGGAIKLLRNPDAKAASLVGAEAVRLNGGNADMTAIEFASKWISRAGSPSSITSGKPGSWRPTGSSSIRGQAYDKAGIRAYLGFLDETMNEEIAKVQEAYGDDPAMLEKSLGELKTAHLQEQVFDEIAPDYSVAFDRTANRVLAQAREKFERKQREADLAAFDRKTVTLEEEKSRFLAGLEPNAEGAADQLFALSGQIDRHYDEAVRRGLMSASAAEDAKARSRRDASVTFYVRQADDMPAQDLAAYREELRKDYAAGDLPNVDGDGFDAIDRQLATLERQRRTQATRALNEVRRRGDDLARKHAAGADVSPAEIAAFEQQIGQSPDAQKAGKSALTRLRIADAIRTMPIREVEQRLPDLAGEGNSDDLAFGRDLVKRHKAALEQDPLMVAERFGVIPPMQPVLGTDDPAAAMGERITAAHAAANHFGVRPRYFTASETQELRNLAATDPDAAMQFGAGLVMAGGQDLPAMLREIGKDAPALSQSGAILAAGGDPEAARAALEGARADAGGKKRPALPQKIIQANAPQIAGTALSLHPAEMGRIRDTAASIARYRLSEEGIDPKSDDAAPVFERAMHEAVGGRFLNGEQFGGFAEYDPGLWWSPRKVIVPPSIKADRFEDVIGALTETDFRALAVPPVDAEGRPYPAAQIKGAMPVATGGGYRFALGDPDSDSPMWVRGADGRPFVLDLGDVPGLRLRVPDAFAEGQ